MTLTTMNYRSCRTQQGYGNRAISVPNVCVVVGGEVYGGEAVLVQYYPLLRFRSAPSFPETCWLENSSSLLLLLVTISSSLSVTTKKCFIRPPLNSLRSDLDPSLYSFIVVLPPLGKNTCTGQFFDKDQPKRLVFSFDISFVINNNALVIYLSALERKKATEV